MCYGIDFCNHLIICFGSKNIVHGEGEVDISSDFCMVKIFFVIPYLLNNIEAQNKHW